MDKFDQVIAHIPARASSKRVRSKNLRLMAGEPMLAYAVRAALGCTELPRVYVNTDSEEIAALGKDLGALVYRRPAELASDTASSDDFNLDMIERFQPDTLVMINPVCPLIESSDIVAALMAYGEADVDTLITSSTTHMQCFHEDLPVNTDADAPLAPSQENTPVHICNWAITIWDAHKFRERMHRKGHAVFGEKRLLFPIAPPKGLKASTEEDFRMIEAILEGRRHSRAVDNIAYWSRSSS